MALRRSLALLLLLGPLVVKTTTVVSNDPKDQQVVSDADKKAAEFCGKVKEVDRGEGRKWLEDGAGGENPVLSILKSANNTAELGEKAADEFGVTFFITKGLPVIMSIIMILIWSICCWTACPFCKCVRCGARERPSSRCCKVFLALAMVGLFCGLVAAMSLAWSGFQNLESGMDTLACSASGLITDILAGTNRTTPGFIGIIPVVNSFDGIVAQLATGSPLTTGIQDILKATKPLDEASYLVSATVVLLKDMMEYPTNVIPAVKSTPTVELIHRCELCTAIAPILKKVDDAVTNGVGQALAKARAEVDKQLTGQKLLDLQASLKKSIKPLEDFKKTIRKTFGYFVTPGQFDSIQTMVQGSSSPLFGVIMVISLILFTQLFCGATSVACYGCMEKRRGADPQVTNPYRRDVHRCAGLTWCCAFWYCIFVFLIGGILVVVSVPLSGLCLVMEDFDRAMLDDIQGALDMKEDEESNMVKEISNKCLSLKSAPILEANNVSRNLMDIILLKEDNGTLVSLRAKVVGAAIDPINKQFNAITESMSGGSGSTLSSNPELVMLRNLLTVTPIDAMILPDPEKIEEDPNLKALLVDDDTRTGAFTSVACSDLTISQDLGGDLAGKKVPGMNTYLQRMGDANLGTPSGSCADSSQKIVCTTVDPVKLSACQAANNLVTTKKNTLRLGATFQCNLFKDPNDPTKYCDVKDMKKENGVWTNDCLFPDGKVQVWEKDDCTLAQFVTYVQAYDQRMEKVFLRLDDAVTGSMEGINKDLRSLVDKFVLDPVYTVLDGLNCQFLSLFYQGVIDGMCYQSVSGFRSIANSYVACAVMAIFLILIMYILWRKTIDNVNAWKSSADAV